jgi:hypothetical protein
LRATLTGTTSLRTDHEASALSYAGIRGNPESRQAARMTFPRIGSTSNSHVGTSFEAAAAKALRDAGVIVSAPLSLRIGVGNNKKAHTFDLGSQNPPVVVECKSHRWTTGGNVPSAKMTVWNEAMYYFAITPSSFRRILFVLRDYSPARSSTLAEYYLRTYTHLIPDEVEVWEFDEKQGSVRILHPPRQLAATTTSKPTT